MKYMKGVREHWYEHHAPKGHSTFVVLSFLTSVTTIAAIRTSWSGSNTSAISCKILSFRFVTYRRKYANFFNIFL